MNSLLTTDLAIDLGTSSISLYACGRGIIATEPTVVAVRAFDPSSSGVIATGEEASRMCGRTPQDVITVRPLKDGAITDFDLTATLLERMMALGGAGRRLMRPRVAIAVAASLNEVERRAIRESAMIAGARAVFLVHQSATAALGLGLPVEEPSGHIVIDIGAGKTEVSVLSLGGVVCSNTATAAGDQMDQAIVDYVKSHYNLLIGTRTAEGVKLALGSAVPAAQQKSLEVTGRDLVAGVPATIELKSEEVYAALSEPIDAIVQTVRKTLEETPPELAADISDRGIVMVGGGSLLEGLAARLRESTTLSVIVAEDALTAVALGAGRCIEDPALLARTRLPG